VREGIDDERKTQINMNGVVCRVDSRFARVDTRGLMAK
jgi:hypothetical protein